MVKNEPTITFWIPPNQKQPHLMVKNHITNEWESIAIIKVPIHEFWERLGLALNTKFADDLKG